MADTLSLHGWTHLHRRMTCTLTGWQLPSCCALRPAAAMPRFQSSPGAHAEGPLYYFLRPAEDSSVVSVRNKVCRPTRPVSVCSVLLRAELAAGEPFRNWGNICCVTAIKHIQQVDLSASLILDQPLQPILWSQLLLIGWFSVAVSVVSGELTALVEPQGQRSL